MGLARDHFAANGDNPMDEMAPVFKALTCLHQRHLLDRLPERDRQTPSELQRFLPMTRFGCPLSVALGKQGG
jgi:hypothetical protein